MAGVEEAHNVGFRQPAGSQEVWAKAANHPVRRWPAVTFSAILLLLSTLIVGLACLPDNVDLSPFREYSGTIAEVISIRTLVLEGFITVLAFGLLAFSAAQTRHHFAGLTCLYLLLALPSIAYICFYGDQVIFITAALVFTGTVVGYSAYSSLGEKFLHAAIQVVFFTWTALALFVRLSQYTGFYQGGDESYLAPLWFLASSRTAIGLLGLLFLLIGALRGLLREEIPAVPSMPAVDATAFRGKSTSPVFNFFLPFVLVASFLLVTLVRSLDLLWKLLAYLAIYLFYFTLNLFIFATETLLDVTIWLRFVRVTLAYVLAIFLALSLEVIATDSVGYLRASDNQGTFLDQWPALYHILVDYLLVFMGAVAAALLVAGWGRWAEISAKAGFGGATMLMIFFGAGIPLYLVNRTGVVSFQGFDHLGMYFLSMSGIMAILVGGQAAMWMIDKGKRTT